MVDMGFTPQVIIFIGIPLLGLLQFCFRSVGLSKLVFWYCEICEVT